MSCKVSEKISGNGEHIISGLLPILNKLAEDIEIRRISPSRMRGKEKAHRQRDRAANIVALKVLYMLPEGGLKCLAVGKNSRQDLIIYGPGAERAILKANEELRGKR